MKHAWAAGECQNLGCGMRRNSTRRVYIAPNGKRTQTPGPCLGEPSEPEGGAP